MKKTSVLIIDSEEKNNLKERFQKAPNFTVVASTENFDIGFTLAERYQPDIILLNVDLPGNDAYIITETFALEFPSSVLILMTNSDSKRVLRFALRTGAREVITFPVEDETMFRMLTRALLQDAQRKDLVKVEKKVKPQFKTITVFSTKGGVGKTTVALNLAMAIQQTTNKRTILVDLNLMAGNVALMSGINPRFTVKDLIDELNNVDSNTVDNYCTEHHSGLRILPAPIDPEFAGFIDAEHIEKILELLSKTYNYVIIDAPNYFHDTVIPALERSQDILVVSTLDLAAIQNLKQCFELLNGLNLKSRGRIVINRLGYTGGLKLKDLEDELGVTVYSAIPNSEKIAINAVNMGSPIYFSSRASTLGRKFEELANKLIVDEDRTVLARGWRKLFDRGVKK